MLSQTGLLTLVSSLALCNVGAATTWKVATGQNGFSFSPNSITAAVGDIVEFHYFPANHSVAQSLFTNPCESTSGFFSGFMPVKAGEGNQTFSITVNDTKPIWFYCSQPGAGGHCAQGMVGAINAPATGNTLALFTQMAMNTTAAQVKQPPIGGGIIAANVSPLNATASSSSSPSSASSTAASTTSAAFPPVLTTSGAMSLEANKWTVMGLGAVLSGLAILVV